MKKRNLIIAGILLVLLVITALFFAIGAADTKNYPYEVLGLKDGNVRVIYSATSSEKLHTKELNGVFSYTKQYPKATEIYGYKDGTLYYWTNNEKNVLYIPGIEGKDLKLRVEVDMTIAAIYAPGVNLTIETGDRTLTLTRNSRYKYKEAVGASIDLSRPNTVSAESGNLVIRGEGKIAIDTTGTGADGAEYGLYAGNVQILEWANLDARMGNKKKEVSFVILTSELTIDTLGAISIDVRNTKNIAYVWNVKVRDEQRFHLINARYLNFEFQKHNLWGDFGTDESKSARTIWTELTVYGKLPNSLPKEWNIDDYYSSKSRDETPYKLKFSRLGSIRSSDYMTVKINGATIDSNGMTALYAGKSYDIDIEQELPEWLLKLEKEGRIVQSKTVEVYEGEKMIWNSDFNSGKLKIAETGTYTLHFEWRYRNPGSLIVWRSGANFKEVTALVLEEGKQIAGPVQYDKGAVSLGSYLKASLPNMSDLDGVEIIWRCVDKDTKNDVLIKGETGLSIKLDKPEYVGKYVYMIARGKPEGKYYGTVFGKEILVEKAYNPSEPPIIDVVATKSKNFYDGFKILNFDRSKFDYFVSKTEYKNLSQIDWSQKLTSSTGSGYYTGDRIYFYYRYAETDTKRAGFIIKSQMLLIDDIVKLGGITIQGTNNGTIFIKPGETRTFLVKLNPSTANDCNTFTVKSPSSYDEQFFEIVSPSKPVSNLKGFAMITIKGKKVGYGSFAMYYAGPSGPMQNTYGGAQVVVYTPDDMGSSRPQLSYTPSYADITLDVGDTFDLPKDLPDLVPADAKGYSAKWGVGKKVKDKLGYTTYIYDYENEYVKIENGKLIAKQKTKDGEPVQIVLCVLKSGEKPSAGYSTSFFLTVNEKPVIKATGVSLNEKSLALHVGNVAKLNAAIMPADAAGTYTIKFTSNNPDVVKVDENTGLITAVGIGNARIYAKANDDSSLVEFCAVSVDAHKFGEWTPSKISESNHQRACFCGETEAEEHAFGIWTNDDAAGKHYHECSVCGNKAYSEHNEGPWITDVDADVGVEGKKHTECYECGKTMRTETEPALVDYAINIVGGKAVDFAGNTVTRIVAGENVTVKADPAPAGKAFAGWKAEGITLDDASAATVVFVMPAGDIKLEAEYKESETPHKHEANTEKWFFDETYHWNACKDKTCSENLNKAEHTFVWKTDKPATETEDGIKHEECSVCGRRRNESTVIPSTGKTPAVTNDPKVTTKPDTPEKPAKKNAWILPTVITVVVLAGAGAGTYFIIKNKKKITGDGGTGNSGNAGDAE